ncbi:hypothetical protein [Corallococcus sicarius]|uniref:Uncharacterized protein n=1 Tax=Corallococcus sicarius TaxID=2316726 RepID=A0A3A8N9H4_9BACT|nr:hypothetical protein [Corallococcus sicarius]RKH40948.1 hypothetical protein D7X12_19530 [Corallococcus sicarius]
MPYTSAQCIGYQVNTFPAAAMGTAYGRKYLGGVKAQPDIRGRCHIMREAIKVAVADPAVRKSSSILKIFMAPEFYFHDVNGAYPIEEVSLIMETLRVFTRQDQFKDWLFVFGTAIAYLDTGSDKEVFNIAMVQRGGTEELGPEASLIVYKEFISHVDFIRNPVYETTRNCFNCGAPNHVYTEGFEGWKRTAFRHALVGKPTDTMSLLRPTEGSRDTLTRREEAVGPGREQTKTGLGGQGAFTMAGIHFGLEVCLDHARSRLRASPPKPGEFYPQIHLIPSGGMSIMEPSIACQQWGIVFNVDATHTALTRNKSYYRNPVAEHHVGLPPGPVTVGSYPPAKAIALNLAGTAPKWNSYFNDQGIINIFQALKIPKAEAHKQG